jgi:serine/threonine-protein phosphatase 2A regulatory subunit B''
VSQPPRDDQVLQQKLREDARAVFLQRRGSELMDNEELTKLWTILEEKHTPPDLGTDEQMISYTAFLDIKDQVSDKCKPFFTAEVFTKLLRDDPYGRVSVSQLFSYIMRKGREAGLSGWTIWCVCVCVCVCGCVF